MSERTSLEASVEQLIVEATDKLMADIDLVRERAGTSDLVTRAMIDRFGGGDLADCWDDYLEATS